MQNLAVLALFDFEHTYVRLHGNFVAYYAVSIANRLGINPYKIGVAAFYHDYGKYRWPRELFIKRNLSSEDWDIIKHHPVDALDIIFAGILPGESEKRSLLAGDPSVADLIYLHHEKPDGSGYYGVKDLPIESVILSICDIFDASLSDRPYRQHLSLREAINNAVNDYGWFLDRKGYDTVIVKNALKRAAVQFTFKKVIRCD